MPKNKKGCITPIYLIKCNIPRCRKQQMVEFGDIRKAKALFLFNGWKYMADKWFCRKHRFEVIHK